jgi:hypothetical protein
MMYYWRAGVKEPSTNRVVLVYFSTMKDYDAVEITEFLENTFGFSCVNCYLKCLTVIEYIANILTCPISSSYTCFNYNRSALIG